MKILDRVDHLGEGQDSSFFSFFFFGENRFSEIYIYVALYGVVAIALTFDEFRKREKLNWKCNVKFLSLAHHFGCIESGLKGGRFYSSFNLEGLVR